MSNNLTILHQNGSSLLEVLLAIGVFTLLAATGLAILSATLTSGRMSADRLQASLYTQEGIEAIRNLQASGWSAVSIGTHGLAWSGSGWSLTGSSDQNGKYTRSITIAQGQRDGSGNIVNTGTPDTNTKKVTSTVTWPASISRNESVSFTTYITQFAAVISTGNWAIPLLQTPLDLSGTLDGLKIAQQGNYLYVTRATGTPNFMVIDITNPLSPTVAGSLTVRNSANAIVTLGGVAAWNNYAYVATTDNSEEVIVINITNPASPTKVTPSYNASGNNDMISLTVGGNYLYAGRVNSVLIFSLAVPGGGANGLTLLSTITISGTVNDLTITADTLCWVTTNTAAEVMCSNVANRSAPTTPTQLNLINNNVGQSIARIGNTLFVGMNTGNLASINAASFPPTLTQITQYSAGGSVLELSPLPGQNLLFLATANSAKEFQVISVSNPASMSEFGFLNTSGTLNDVYYLSSANVTYATSAFDTGEIIVVKPSP